MAWTTWRWTQECQHCGRENFGSGYHRVVNLPDRPHPGAAPAFHCADCGRHIGKTRMHVLVGTDVICMRCWERRHYDERSRMCSRAAAAQLLGIWPGGTA
jgi:hypothetical protein